jgi:hypothetical protein
MHVGKERDGRERTAVAWLTVSNMSLGWYTEEVE